MKFKILAEISCDSSGKPVYQEETIDCAYIFPNGSVNIMSIEEKDGIVNINIKERFKITGSEDFRSISKDNFVSSKRVGKYALNRCFNCEKADSCKFLTKESTIIRHY